MPKEKTVDMHGNIDAKDGHLNADSNVGVHVGPFDASVSSSGHFGKDGYSVETSSNSNVGGVLGSSDSYSESMGKDGISTQQRHRENFFGLRSSENKDFSLGAGGISSSHSQSVKVGGVGIESHSHVKLDGSGLSVGDHASIAGKKMGYSFKIPPPKLPHAPNVTGFFKDGIESAKKVAGHVAQVDGLQKMTGNLASMASEATKLAHGAGQLASNLSGHVKDIVPENAGEMAADLAKVGKDLAVLGGQIAKLGVQVGKVAVAVGKEVVPVVVEIAKAIK